MAINRVEYGDTVLMDISGDSVNSNNLLVGATAHDASGEPVDGAVDLNNYYTKNETEGYVNQQIGAQDFSNFATKADIPSTAGLATEQFVNAAVDAAKPDLSGYALKGDIPSLAGYATEQYVKDNQPDLTDYAKKGDIPSTSGLASTKYVDDEVAEVVKVASGKTASYVFDTVAALDSWLAVAANTANLNKGDVFLIKAVNVPDYWWDGSGKSILETTKVDLSGYALTANVPGIKVNNAGTADNSLKVGGYTIVISNTAPTNADANTITFVV